jgi:hypothetical protein
LRLVFVLVGFVVLAGCAQNGSPIGLASLHPPVPHILSVDVTPARPEIGDTLHVIVTVNNSGGEAGTTALQVKLEDATLGTQAIPLPRDTPIERTFSGQLARGGDLALTVDLLGVEKTTILHVGAPLVHDAQLEPENTWCSDKMPVNVVFTNAGDATIHEATVDLVVTEKATGTERAYHQVGGPFAPGAQATIPVEIEVHDVCGEDDFYSVAGTLAAPYVPTLHLGPLNFTT